MSHLVIYCVDCEWFASPEDHSRSEQSDHAIDHHVATGHTIESTPQGGKARDEPAAGWAEKWPPGE